MKLLLVFCFILFSFYAEASKWSSKKTHRKHSKASSEVVVKTPAACNKLEVQYQESFAPLNKVVTDKQTKYCVYSQEISAENLNFFIRAAFYYKNAEVRKKAFDKLDSFACGLKVSCQDFYKIIDTHQKAVAHSQKKVWQGFSVRADSLKEKALARLHRL